VEDDLLFFDRFDKQGDESGIIQRYSVPASGWIFVLYRLEL
jgi:hypothetical protein